MSSLTDKLISPVAWALAREPESWALFLIPKSSITELWPQPSPLPRPASVLSNQETPSKKTPIEELWVLTDYPLKVRHAAPRLMDSSGDKDRSLFWQWQRADLKASIQDLVPFQVLSPGIYPDKRLPSTTNVSAALWMNCRQCRYQSASPYRKLLIIIFIKLLFDIVFPYLQIFYQTHFKN